MKEEIRTENAPQPLAPYSQGILFNENLVFVSGQTGLLKNPKGLDENDIVHQTNRTLNNIEAILNQVGCDLSDVLKVSVYLSDFADFSNMNEVYSKRFTKPYPTRTTVAVGLAENILVEIDVIASYRNNNKE